MRSQSWLLKKPALALALVLSTLLAPSSHALGIAPGVLCESLFRAEPSSRVEEWRQVHILRPVIDDVPLLDRTTLKRIFENAFDGGSAGKAALTHMKTLPVEMPNVTKVKIWLELVRYINNIEFIIFYSDMYTLPGNRFLFRGGAGESLFIDSDGVMYRTRTAPLDRADTWEAHYSEFRRIN